MSECRICRGNGKAGVQITFSDKIRSQYSQKMIPLEIDGSTYHRHYEPTNTTTSEAVSPSPAVTKTITPTKPQEDAALEALTLEFKTLVKHMSEYLKAHGNG
jgi:hypothetical protein